MNSSEGEDSSISHPCDERYSRRQDSKYCQTEVHIDLEGGGVEDNCNFNGTLTRCRLSEGERTLALIVKVALRDPAYSHAFNARNKYINEVNFYTKIYPILSRFGPLPTLPRALWSSLEEGKEVLVLEDLRELGYKTGSIRDGLDDQELDMTLKALDKLYAASRALRREEPKTFQKLSSLVGETFCVGHYFNDVAIKCVENAIRIAEEHLGKEFVDKMRKFDIVKEMLSELKATDDPVITHGDAWPCNILFKYDQTGELEDVALIDWQMCRIGSPLLDISYLLFTSAPDRICPCPSKASRFGFGMALILLPFTLGQADPGLVITPERITFSENKIASAKIAAAIKSAVLSGVI